ncbi:MAG: glycosyltransferase family 2 protein [Bacteroidales bacterium]|nr:glycosyltransferase family 2 protein [Bacteroidales bacterium]
MVQTPLLSVLIANYNNGCYLQEAIDSVLAQNYENWEIVIVDDNSTDTSFEIYDKYRNDARFHMYYNNENKGVGYTKRRCVEVANGEICSFIDPDDVLVGRDVFDLTVQAHLNHPNASMVYSGMYRTDEHLNVLRESPGVTLEAGISILQTRSWPLHHFLSFKKEFYNKTEGIDAFMRRAVDYDMYYKLEEVGELVHLDGIQYKQRNNPHSISLNDNSYKANAWHVYACINAMKRRGLTDESLMLFPMEAAMRNASAKGFEKGYEKATSSRTYKAGKIIAFPLSLLRKIWKK